MAIRSKACTTTRWNSAWPRIWAGSAGARRSRAAACRPSTGARSASCSGTSTRPERRWLIRWRALDRLLVSLTALCGFALDDMTQDDGWRMLMLGRRLERIQFLAGLLSARLAAAEPLPQGELEWLLDVGGVSITYRTRYVATPQLAPVLQLLIFEDASPRALAFQWRGAARHAGDSGRVAQCASRLRQLERPDGAADRDRHRRRRG